MGYDHLNTKRDATASKTDTAATEPAVELDVHGRARKEGVRAEGARMRALADALPQMVWTFSSTNGSATYTNERFRESFGPIQ